MCVCVCIRLYSKDKAVSVIEVVESCVERLPFVVLTDEHEMDLETFKGIKYAAPNLVPE